MYKRPKENEYSPFYHTYVKHVPEGDIVPLLKDQLQHTIKLVKNLTDEQAHFRYKEDKWSVKEVIGHMIDTERIMSYRLLCIARGDQASLPGFDEQNYAKHANFNEQEIEVLIQQFEQLRQSTIYLLQSIPDHVWKMEGTVSDYPITVQALAAIISGHELHHRHILIERYGLNG